MPSGGELLLVLLVILLLFGAKNLPKMARTLGRTLEEFRRAARDVSDEIMQADDDTVRPKPLLDAVERKPSTSQHSESESGTADEDAEDEDEPVEDADTAPKPPEDRAT